MSSITSTLKIAKSFLSKNIVSTISFLLAIYIFVSADLEADSSAEIIFFDVGQGDAILIQQDNFQVLVDGGADDTVIYRLAKVMPLYDKNIEIVVLTHPHDDHIRGLMNVLEEFNVQKVFVNRIEYENRAYNRFLEEYESILVEVKDGDSFRYKNIFGTVIYPSVAKRDQERNINNESVVMLIEILDYRVLLMGDAEKEVEKELLKTHDLKNTYILKAGHHCSKTASSEMFLKEVQPKIAICSCGEGNKFGHPHYETIENFQKYNVQYFKTCREGNIVIKFDDL